MAFDVIGGVGAGLMQGSQFVANQRQQRENNKYRDAIMGMQQERHNWQRQQVEQQQDERKRIDALNTLKIRIEDVYKDRPDFEREQMYFENALGTGLIRPDELKVARESYEGLIQNFGLEAVDEFYLTGKVDGLNRIISQRMPGAKIEAGQRGNLRVTDPSGAVNELDAMGIKQLLSLNKAIERQAGRDQAGLAAEKERSAIEANRELAHQRMNPTTSSRSTSGATGSRAAQPGPANEGPRGILGRFDKSMTDVTKDLNDFIPDEGLVVRTADGGEDFIPKSEVLSRVRSYMDDISGAEGAENLSYERIREIAMDMVRYENGEAGQGIYQPTPSLNEDTGEWELRIRTGGRRGAGAIDVRLPSANVQPTEEQREEANSQWVGKMIEDGTARALHEAFSDPQVAQAFARARNNPQAMAEMERVFGVPALQQRVEELYTRGIFGNDVLIPAQDLAERKQRHSERRGSIQREEPRSAGLREMPRELTDEDRMAAREAGFDGRWKPVETVRGLVGDIAEGWKHLANKAGEKLTDLEFSNAANIARATGFRYGPAVDLLADAIAANPSRRHEFTEEELFLIDFANRDR